MLVISPGIRTMVWSILRFDRREIRAKCLAFNIEHHGNKRFTVRSFEDMIARSWVHWLIITVLLGRYTPGVVAMGEQAEPNEPKEHADAARCLLRTIFLNSGIPVVEFDGGREGVLRVLGASPRQVTTTVERLIGRIPKKAKDSRVKGAMLTGAAAARLLFELPVEQPVSRETGNQLGGTEDGPAGLEDAGMDAAAVPSDREDRHDDEVPTIHRSGPPRRGSTPPRRAGPRHREVADSGSARPTPRLVPASAGVQRRRA